MKKIVLSIFLTFIFSISIVSADYNDGRENPRCIQEREKLENSGDYSMRISTAFEYAQGLNHYEQNKIFQSIDKKLSVLDSEKNYRDTPEVLNILSAIKCFNNGLVSFQSNEDIIKKYYQNIVEKDYENAYSLKYKPSISIKQFINQYTEEGDIKMINIVNIQDQENGIKTYTVNIAYGDIFLFQEYNISAEIINGKIHTRSVEKINRNNTVKIELGKNINAYIQYLDGEQMLFLENKGQKKLIHTIGTKYGTKGDFYDIGSYGEKLQGLELLKGNEIFKFHIRYGFGWRENGFYSLNSGKTVFSRGELSLYGVTTDSKFFYLCGLDGMGGSHELKIFETTSLKTIRDFSQTDWNNRAHCTEYNEEFNSLTYYFHNDHDLFFTYYFDSGKTIENK